VNLSLFASPNSIDDAVVQAREAADRGFGSLWLSQIFSLDALTAIAVAGREVPGIGFGTAVIPTYPRHPMMLAAQALTTQAATGNRLTLGIGLSHQVVIEQMFGMSFDKPVRHMREYLDVLMPLVRTRKVAAKGETISATAALDIAGTEPPPVVVAALGPQMLRLVGRVADGTVTWMVGAKTLGSHIAPRIREAADEAGRGEPRVVVALPVAVTDDEAATRAQAAELFQVYGGLPSYRAMLDREGAGGPADVAIVGDEASVRGQIEDLFAQGATEFVAAPFAERERTLDALANQL